MQMMDRRKRCLIEVHARNPAILEVIAVRAHHQPVAAVIPGEQLKLQRSRLIQLHFGLGLLGIQGFALGLCLAYPGSGAKLGEQVETIDVENAGAEPEALVAANAHTCNACGASVEFDDLPDRYFMFLGSAS